MKPAPPVTSTRSPIRGSLWVRPRRPGRPRRDASHRTGRSLPGLARRRRRSRPGLPLAIGIAIVLAAFAIAGCGGGSSSTTSGPRLAAEPAESPPLGAKPAGLGIAVGDEPEGVAWDAAAELIAVGVRDPAQIVFVDPRNLSIAGRVPLPAPPRHLGYDEAAGTILVPAESADELIVVRPQGIVSQTKVGTHPHDAAAVDEDVFVADEHSDQVSVVRDGKLVDTLHAPHQPGGIAAVDRRWIALVAVSARVLQVYDARTLQPLDSLAAGVGPSHIVAGSGDTAYVADTQGDRILVYEVGRHARMVGEVNSSGTPYGLAVDASRHRLWVTETATNRLVEYDTRGKLPRRVASYPTVRQPNSVAVDPRTGQVFVAGREDGRLERIDPPRGKP